LGWFSQPLTKPSNHPNLQRQHHIRTVANHCPNLPIIKASKRHHLSIIINPRLVECIAWTLGLPFQTATDAVVFTQFGCHTPPEATHAAESEAQLQGTAQSLW
jgi:hypothetical protein